MKTYQHLACIGAVALLLSACGSSPKPKAEIAPTPTASSPAPTQPPPAVAQSTVAKVVVPDYLDPNNPISKDRSVFFGFDQYSVDKTALGMIERHGKYLSKNASLKVHVEGNTDERGGAEYNLALGQKRAEAVVKALRVYGVKDEQMEAVSWGREKPRAAGHDEASWSQNRRVDLTYPNK